MTIDNIGNIGNTCFTSDEINSSKNIKESTEHFFPSDKSTAMSSLSSEVKGNSRKISLNEKIKHAIGVVLTKLKSLFKFSSHTYEEKIKPSVSELENVKQKLDNANQELEKGNQKIEELKKTIQSLNDLQTNIETEKETDVNLAKRSEEIEDLKQEIARLNELLKQKNDEQQQTLDVLTLIKNDTSDPFINNDIVSILNKEQPKEPLNNADTSSDLTAIDSNNVPAAPQAPRLNIKIKTETSTNEITQANFNELVSKVFNFVKKGQPIFIEGLSEKSINVFNVTQFTNEKSKLEKELERLNKANAESLNEIDKTIDAIKNLCNRWLTQLPKNLTLQEADGLKNFYAENPIQFFSDINKLKNLNLLNDNIFNPLKELKEHYNEGKIKFFSDKIKSYNEESKKLKGYKSKLNMLKLDIPNDKTAKLLQDLIKTYKGDTFADFKKAHEDLNSLIGKIKPLTNDQKEQIKQIDNKILTKENELNEAIENYFKKEETDYKGTDQQKQFAILKSNDENIIKINKEIGELKGTKRNIQKEAISIESLLQEMINPEKPQTNSFAFFQKEQEEMLENQKKHDFLSAIRELRKD